MPNLVNIIFSIFIVGYIILVWSLIIKSLHHDMHIKQKHSGPEKPISANVQLRLKTEEGQTFRHGEGELDKSAAVVLTYNESLRNEFSEHYHGVEMTEKQMRILHSGLYFFYMNFEFKFAPSTEYYRADFKCPGINVVREREGSEEFEVLISYTPPCYNGAGYHSSYHDGKNFTFEAEDCLLVILTDPTIFNPEATFAVIGLYRKVKI